MLVGAAEQLRQLGGNIDAYFTRKTCRGNGDASLFTQTAQHFHFNYALLREKYFQTLKQYEDITNGDVREAERYGNLNKYCFHHVKPFTDNPDAWLGYFVLMHAELLARRGVQTAQRSGRAAATADLDAARLRYREAQQLLQRGVARADELDKAADATAMDAAAERPNPKAAARSEARDNRFTRLEQALLGGTRIWSLHLDRAKNGIEALALADR